MNPVVGDRPLIALGVEQLEITGTAQGLPNIPSDASYVYLQSQGGSLRWTDDGVDPTGDIGLIIANGDTLFYNGDRLYRFRFILKTGEPTSYLALAYYKVA
jgi:hypothetical protein